MKKIGLLALAVAALAGTSTVKAQEVTYVEDCSQGLLINKAPNNWFITLQGGANFLWSHNDIHADIKNRIGPQASIYVGKWVTPVFGFRFGAAWTMPKGATTADGFFRKMNSNFIKEGSDLYAEKFMGLGPEFDVMLNLTNWWCGYKPNRVYNAILHGGAGAYWTFARRYKDNDIKWRAAKNTVLFANVGLQNNFSLSKHFDIFLDLRYDLIDFSNVEPAGDYKAYMTASANLGFTYNFGKTDWNCPVTAVCPTWKYTDAEGDQLKADLDAAKRRIRDLEDQLSNCKTEFEKGRGNKRNCEDELCIIYYPINVATLSQRDKLLLNSVADVMTNSGKNFNLTGWADNYTGNDQINTSLRQRRVDGVYKYLQTRGVPAGIMNPDIDNNNRIPDGNIDIAPLDRAVTIEYAK